MLGKEVHSVLRSIQIVWSGYTPTTCSTFHLILDETKLSSSARIYGHSPYPDHLHSKQPEFNLCVAFLFLNFTVVFIYLFIFRAAPMACGGSQARSWIGAVATNLRHSSWQCRILNPLRGPKDWTCVLMDASQIHFHLAMTGTPRITIFIWRHKFFIPRLGLNDFK